jgi:hypothetical protein
MPGENPCPCGRIFPSKFINQSFNICGREQQARGFSKILEPPDRNNAPAGHAGKGEYGNGTEGFHA